MRWVALVTVAACCWISGCADRAIGNEPIDGDGSNGIEHDGGAQDIDGGPPPIVCPPDCPLSLVAAGSRHTCAIQADTTVACWGNNWFGQLGNGSEVDESLTPVPVAGLTNIASIAAGTDHTCAVRDDGTAWCWGDNMEGQLGDVTPEYSSPVPVKVVHLSNITSIAAGWFRTCAVASEGHVNCWGLRSGESSGDPMPVPVSGLDNAVSITAAEYTVCAVLADTTGVCWGSNLYGQLGAGIDDPGRNEPVPVVGLTGITEMSVGGSHTCAVKDDGTAWCWGANEFGELGDGSYFLSNVPVRVLDLSRVHAVAAGALSSCAMTLDGTVHCWGENRYGQLGNGTLDLSNLPIRVSGLDGVVHVTAGHYHACTLNFRRDIHCWGRNDHGQLGNGTDDDSNVPVQVTFP